MSENTADRPTTTRMFETELLERFSRIHPATPFVAWVPVVCFFVWRALALHHVSVVRVAAIFAAGVLAWTLAEYVLHRFVFHWVNDTALGKRVHFVLHGVHHDYPSDKDRLVMPLGASIPLAFLFYGAFRLTMPQGEAEAFFAGFVLGYLGYDGTHYAIHHFQQRTRLGRFVKRHHMLHHHADSQGGYGVSTPLWDYVFQTVPRPGRSRRLKPAQARTGTPPTSESAKARLG